MWLGQGHQLQSDFYRLCGKAGVHVLLRFLKNVLSHFLSASSPVSGETCQVPGQGW